MAIQVGGKLKNKIGITCLFSLCFFCSFAYADIDMSVIAQIESSGDPLAYNSGSKATGLYGITPICLKDYNQYHKIKYALKDMFNQGKCYDAASWYLKKRIPQMLKYYELEVTIDHILICYDFGIGHLVNGDKIPKETKDYLMKYKERIKEYDAL